MNDNQEIDFDQLFSQSEPLTKVTTLDGVYSSVDELSFQVSAEGQNLQISTMGYYCEIVLYPSYSGFTTFTVGLADTYERSRLGNSSWVPRDDVFTVKSSSGGAFIFFSSRDAADSLVQMITDLMQGRKATLDGKLVEYSPKMGWAEKYPWLKKTFRSIIDCTVGAAIALGISVIFGLGARIGWMVIGEKIMEFIG